MRIYSISDLHLSFACPKPMEKFGGNWKDHPGRIRDQWNDAVSDDDITLIPGDISWANTLDEAIPDLTFLASLPGKKVLVKGNHDYWWQSISKLRSVALDSLLFIQYDIIEIEGVAITGTRLWNFPFTNWEDKAAGWQVDDGYNDQKIQNREINRLRRCLAQIQPLNASLKICMTHFPPVGSAFIASSRCETAIKIL